MSRPGPDTYARRLLLSLVLLVFGAHAARAATQTYVSAKGDDANPCDYSSPCRTFAGALAKTANRGEVAVLDSGEYGTFTVTFSVRVTAVGVYAGVTAFDQNGVNIKPPAGAFVALRGLTLTGWSSSLGIFYLGPTEAREGEPTAYVHVEDCTLSGFSIAGILFEGNGELFVKDTTVRNTLGAGIRVDAYPNQKARATVVNTRLEKNMAGLHAKGQGGVVEVAARDTVAAGNSSVGFTATGWDKVKMQLHDCVSTNQSVGVSALYTARLSVEGCTLSGNGTGVWAQSDGLVHLSNTTITANAVGIYNVPGSNNDPGGHVHTFGNNRLFENTLDTKGAPIFSVQQF